MTPLQITSQKNSKIQNIKLLQSKSKVRGEKGLFVVEGKKETERAIQSHYILRELYLCPQLLEEDYLNAVKELTRESKQNFATYFITKEIYSKIAYREGTEGVISIFEKRELLLNNINLSSTPLVIILESVEKPGNLGAILRTADAVKADAVIICDPLTDIFNPNVVRASIGTLFTNQVSTATSQDAYQWLLKNNITIFTTQLQDSQWFYNQNFGKSSAVVMGTESLGLSDFWKERADHKIKIPMLGLADSLNVSVSTAIICYEIFRQREFEQE